MMLWSNPDDIVRRRSWGSALKVVALELGRRFVGAELKASYYRQTVANLANAIKLQNRLFSWRAADALHPKRWHRLH